MVAEIKSCVVNQGPSNFSVFIQFWLDSEKHNVDVSTHALEETLAAVYGRRHRPRRDGITTRTP